MKNGSSLSGATPAMLAILAVLALDLSPVTARAAETRVDTESDHVDAFDDVGPRTFAVLAEVGTDGLQAVGPRIGAELNLGLGDAAALSLRGDWLALAAAEGVHGAAGGSGSAGAGGYGVSLGVLLFPGRVPFHGLYVHPRASWQRVAAGGASADVVGAALTVGYAWTSRWGGTLRLGLGASYDSTLSGAAPAMGSSFGLQPVADAAVGWVF
jgi:hypothetical protein